MQKNEYQLNSHAEIDGELTEEKIWMLPLERKSQISAKIIEL